jgi:hypothetical protein
VKEERLAVTAENHAKVVAKNIKLLDKSVTKLVVHKPIGRTLWVSLGPHRAIEINTESGSVSEARPAAKRKSLALLRKVRFG